VCETGVAADIESLWKTFNKAGLILIDIPIGLASNSQRACDAEARRFLGPRASCVFSPPCREALYAENYRKACNINQKILGKKISRQAYNILPKIREVDELLRSHPPARKRIRESHPEVCFRALAGEPVLQPKKTAEGFAARLAILSRYLPDAGKIIAEALARFRRKDVKRDDVVDSMVAAVAAGFGKDRLVSLPQKPERDKTGLAMEIVYPFKSTWHMDSNIISHI